MSQLRVKKLSMIAAAVTALLGTCLPASGQTTIRPISDWLQRQGTFCWPDPANPGDCLIFVPPIPNFVGFSSPNLCASVDYAGLAAAWLAEPAQGVSLGTTMQGTVVERRLADGTAEVHVVLHTKTALTWLVPAVNYACDFAAGPLLYGRRAPDLLGGQNPASLSEVMLEIAFTNTQPGAPLPDFMELFCVFGSSDPRQLKFSAVRAHGDGELRAAFGVPDGTRGRATIVQNGIFRASWKGALADGFPVELIRLQPLGK